MKTEDYLLTAINAILASKESKEHNLSGAVFTLIEMYIHCDENRTEALYNHNWGDEEYLDLIISGQQNPTWHDVADMLNIAGLQIAYGDDQNKIFPEVEA